MSAELRLKGLGPPPRPVPAALRVRLLANLGTLIGGIILGIGGGVAVVSVLAADPVGNLRLARRAVEVQGRLIAVEKTNNKENHQPIYRCRFVFQTPDGVEHAGRSYVRGRAIAPPPPQAAHDPKRRPRVTVEYSPEHPETSRIKGTRVGVLPLVAGALLTVPAVGGLVVLVAGLLYGRGSIHLLENGQPAEATLVSCQLAEGSQPSQRLAEVPFAEFRKTWLARSAPGGSTADHEAPQVLPAARVLASGLLKLWTCGAFAIVGFGTLMLLGALAAVLIAQRPFMVNGQPAARNVVIPALLGFLAVWLVVGMFLIRGGRMASAVASGRLRPEQVNPHPRIVCTFELHLPGGQVVRAKDTIRFHEGLGDTPTEPALYDPDGPERALLIDSLPASVRVSEFGEWETTAGWSSWLRAGLIAAIIVAGPTLGWTLWHAL